MCAKDEKTVEEIIIAGMRQKLQNTAGRKNLFVLMIKEIQLQMMQDKKQIITHGEALDQLQEEFDCIVTYVREDEKKRVMTFIAKEFGIC